MTRGRRTGGEAFARKLDALIKQAGFKQAYVAEQIGVWDSLVTRWRNGGGITVDNVRKLADLFGVDRGDLEKLAGYGDNQLSSVETSKTEIDLERQHWGAWYQHLMDSKVPHSMWTAYTKACEALADAFRAGPGALSSSDVQPVSKAPAESDEGSTGPDKGRLSPPYRRSTRTYRFDRLSAAPAR